MAERTVLLDATEAVIGAHQPDLPSSSSLSSVSKKNSIQALQKEFDRDLTKRSRCQGEGPVCY